MNKQCRTQDVRGMGHSIEPRKYEVSTGVVEDSMYIHRLVELETSKERSGST